MIGSPALGTYVRSRVIMLPSEDPNGDYGIDLTRIVSAFSCPTLRAFKWEVSVRILQLNSWPLASFPTLWMSDDGRVVEAAVARLQIMGVDYAAVSDFWNSGWRSPKLDERFNRVTGLSPDLAPPLRARLARPNRPCNATHELKAEIFQAGESIIRKNDAADSYLERLERQKFFMSPHSEVCMRRRERGKGSRDEQSANWQCTDVRSLQLAVNMRSARSRSEVEVLDLEVGEQMLSMFGLVNAQLPRQEKDVTSFVKKTRFYLHPDYRPYHVVDDNDPPFHLSRYGWSDCLVRLQVHFVDPRNKPFDIIFILKLERSFSFSFAFAVALSDPTFFPLKATGLLH
ncbi:hypothetical protein BDK51DRAFT_37265 [Blyttiomyces helicus]|uniref:Protein AF-9 homolog n=1 Tax=Blyttiomyces helicus TaxID=388810 RepID=A0A4P9VYC7_9FUNG|nr:hypothetical protein BDK51DRAFT_37265 [Blyttiomyces helicus]|eukprot:RKO83955.1 hypothetical protein BDK51DRAFT_37265 [Blyttiomyces helicus]